LLAGAPGGVDWQSAFSACFAAARPAWPPAAPDVVVIRWGEERVVITALVMIGCEVGKVNEVAEALVEVDGVAEVYSISGPHDIMALVRVKEYDALAAVVSERIGQTKGIRTTETHMAFRCYSKHDMERMWAFHLGDESAPGPAPTR